MFSPALAMTWAGCTEVICGNSVRVRNELIVKICEMIKSKKVSGLLNLLTTDDTFWRHLTLATCYQLVLKIGSVLSERVGQG